MLRHEMGKSRIRQQYEVGAARGSSRKRGLAGGEVYLSMRATMGGVNPSGPYMKKVDILHMEFANIK